MAVGFSAPDGFRHVMITHQLQDEWTSFAFDQNDLVFRLQKQWAAYEPADIGDVRVYVKGTPGPCGGVVELREAGAWRARPGLRRRTSDIVTSTPQAVLESLRAYLERKNDQLDEQVEGFLVDGEFPVTGTTRLDWPPATPRPEGIDQNPTFRYIWHSLYPAAYMLIYAQRWDRSGAAFAGHRLVDQWLTESFFSVDEDQRYAWYDHGTAERLVSLLLAHDDAQRRQLDVRYLTRLGEAIDQHGMLLESEAFYAANQVTRFHNHAWFQDLALMAAGAVSSAACAPRWIETATRRLTRQVRELICVEDGYAVFVENSIGYHHAIQSLIEFADEMLQLTAGDSSLRPMAKGLARFSGALRYGDGRAPAQGDTFRRPNGSVARATDSGARRFVTLPRAGYTFARGDDGHDLMFFATSLGRTHKHCDNLSIALFHRGVEWLIDPSFLSHDYAAEVPRYLRGPWAHNVLALADVDYNIEPGLCRHSADRAQDLYRIEGTHGAFEGFTVSRTVEGRLDRLDVLVVDELLPQVGSTEVPAAVVLHLGEGVDAEPMEAGMVTLSHGASGSTLILEYDLSLRCEVVEGWNSHDPTRSSVAGTTFGVYVPTASVLLHLDREGTARWRIRANAS